MTGGSSGIGLATVKILAVDGAEVVMLDLPQSKGQEEADKLGPSVTFVAADVSYCFLIYAYVLIFYKSYTNT